MEADNSSNRLENSLPPENIPEAIKRIDAWMGTRLELRPDGKTNKRPYKIDGDRAHPADKTDPRNWCTFDEAVRAMERGIVDAIGFVFSDRDGYTVVDLDGVVNPETGEISQRAVHIATTLYTYTELSISGTG